MTGPTASGASAASPRWVVEEYATSDWSDYPTWMPIKGGTYYATEGDAQEAREALVDDDYQSYIAAREKDERECVERAAVYEKARSAVQGMPQANLLSRHGYRTEPIKRKERSAYEGLYRVARVTSFQERVQALLDATRGEMVDKDDLLACFDEGTLVSRDSVPPEPTP